MKSLLVLLLLLSVSACGGAEAPSAFQPDSPASPTTTPAPRLPVATVLAASDPGEASLCVPGKPCALPEAPTSAPAGGHDHGNHGGGHDHGNHNH